MKKIVIGIIDFFLGALHKRKAFYGFFYFLLLRSLRGMEIGHYYGTLETSGEKNVIDLLKKYSKNPVIFDGGANVGEYSLLCADIEGSSVISFEPASATFLNLKKNIAAKPNIKAHQQALSDTNKKLLLKSDRENSQIASVVDCDFSHYNLYLDKTEEVDGITIDSYCENGQITRINLLKLDLEGYEFTALMGARRMIAEGKIDMIQFEIGRANVDSRIFFKDFYKLLSGQFGIFRILSSGLVPIKNYSYEQELFLGANYLAINKNMNSQSLSGR
jgi:FkbM family methyltransferase